MATRGHNDQAGADRPIAVIVQQGKVLDYIDGVTQRTETPEEYVRQEIAKSLVREYGYRKRDISVEFTLRLGTRRPRADLVIFDEDDAHDQDRARIIVECKSRKIKPASRKDGVGQLHSYMAACPNAAYGMWTNGVERFCFRRRDASGTVRFVEIPDIPNCGSSEEEAERPRGSGDDEPDDDAVAVGLCASDREHPATGGAFCRCADASVVLAEVLGLRECELVQVRKGGFRGGEVCDVDAQHGGCHHART